jgi:hypothetical protein
MPFLLLCQKKEKESKGMEKSKEKKEKRATTGNIQEYRQAPQQVSESSSHL